MLVGLKKIFYDEHKRFVKSSQTSVMYFLKQILKFTVLKSLIWDFIKF